VLVHWSRPTDRGTRRKAALNKAEERRDALAKEIDAERDALDHRAQREEVRWEK
jgi:hypothetical protein